MNNEGAKLILSKDIKEITKSLLENMFAAYHDKATNTFKQANYDMSDEFVITKEDYRWVDKPTETTLGSLFFNRYVLEGSGVIDEVHYWNEELTSGKIVALSKVIGNLATVGVIQMKNAGEFTDRRDKLGFWCASFGSSSISGALLRPMDDVNKRKDELFKENAEILQTGTPVEQIMTTNKIEKELMDMVRNNLKSDSGYDLYASGVGNLNNNYKTINVMRGAVFNNITKKYDIVENSLMAGITKKDIPAYSNSVTAAAYPSAVGTAEAGLMAKIILALLQSEHLDPDPNSDCGTKSTIEFLITDKNKEHLLFRYIDNGGKPLLLTPTNIGSYVDKMVNLYSPQCCMNSALCGKCGGRLFHNLGATRAGLLSTAITQKMLNLKLKMKHDLSQSAGIVPEDFLFYDKNKLYTIERGILKNKVTMKLFIPRLLEEISGFVKEATFITCMGVFPVKFYDKDGKEILSTMLTAPIMLTFDIYDDIQEDIDNYIVTYDPDSEVCNLGYQMGIVNVEIFINQIYLYSKTPQIPYNMLTLLMFRCLEMNKVDLTGPSITYEMLARRMCRKNGDTFAKVYGKNPNVDQLSYDKLPYRRAVQEAGVLQGILFQDSTKAINIGLSQTLNGIQPEDTPLEKIIKA